MRYRQMLEAVYPVVKAHAPKVQVIAGALMQNEYQQEFLRAMRHGPADAISFHCYLQIDDPFTRLTDMVARLSAITDIPLILSETAVLATVNGDRLEARQAEYMRWLISDFATLGLAGVKWYTLANNGPWMESDLVRQNVARPAYREFL
jgi:hypothetical protein